MINVNDPRWQSEINFWDRFLRDEAPNGFPSFVDWRDTYTTGRPFEWAHLAPNARLALDVGSGPLLRWGGTPLWVCVDPLADVYAVMRQIYDVKSRANTHLTSLDALKKRMSFDVAIISNALDHAEDPSALLEQTLAVTHGPVIVRGFRNEGSQARGEGLHTWDCDVALDPPQFLLRRWNDPHHSVIYSVAGRKVVSTRFEDCRRPSFECVFEART